MNRALPRGFRGAVLAVVFAEVIVEYILDGDALGFTTWGDYSGTAYEFSHSHIVGDNSAKGFNVLFFCHMLYIRPHKIFTGLGLGLMNGAGFGDGQFFGGGISFVAVIGNIDYGGGYDSGYD